MQRHNKYKGDDVERFPAGEECIKGEEEEEWQEAHNMKVKKNEALSQRGKEIGNNKCQQKNLIETVLF